MLKFSFRVVLSCTLAVTLCGCAQFENLNIGRVFQPFAVDQSANDAESYKARSEQLLTQGKFVEALALLQEGIDSGIEQQQLAKQLVRAMNQLLAQADHQSSQQLYLEAGILYRNALNHFPTDAAVSLQISRTADQIRAKIAECANQLLEDGLVAYRAGSLEQAIDVWSKIRQFHPTYKASQQAIRTTRTQLKNLEAVNPASPENGS